MVPNDDSLIGLPAVIEPPEILNLTIILLGDVTLSPDAEFDDDSTQAFILESVDDEMCEDAPDGLLITAPEGQRARIVVNNVELVMSSTLFITAEVDDLMTLQGLEGQIDVTAQGQTESLTVGFFTTVPLDGLTPDGPPEPPEPIPPGDEFPLSIQTALVTTDSGVPANGASASVLTQTYSDDLVTFRYPDGWGARRNESWVEFSNNPDLINIPPPEGTNTTIPPGSLIGLVLSPGDFSDGATTGDGAIRAFANGIFFERRQDWIIDGPRIITIGDIEVTKFVHLLPSTGMDDLRITNFGFGGYVLAVLHVDPEMPFEVIIEEIIQSVE